MAFQRRILHHGSDPDGIPQILSLAAIKNCWFELHRQGGCGSGQLVLSEVFEQRELIQVGDWISCEGTPGDRWYLGRVEERQAVVPAGLKLRLEGMSIELNQYFPGGFGSDADGDRPHVYGATGQFPLDPDGAIETFDGLSSAEELVSLLMTQSVPATSHIQYVPERVEPPDSPAPVTSLKVRGEESVRSILKDLALRAQSAAWGVDEHGEFFFLRPRTEVLATFQDRRDLTSMSEYRDLDFVFNRILLTGDYVYDQLIRSDDTTRRAYRWRANFLEPISRAQFGDRRIRIWLPWIRTQSDAIAFSRQFFSRYSQPSSRFLVEATVTDFLPRPWQGRIQINNAGGEKLIAAMVETVRVKFDHVPLVRMELGPVDPRLLWPEPPQDERWELPNQQQSAGGPVSLPSTPEDPGDGLLGGGGGNAGGQDSNEGSTMIDDSLSLSSEVSEDSGESDLSFDSDPSIGTDITADVPETATDLSFESDDDDESDALLTSDSSELESSQDPSDVGSSENSTGESIEVSSHVISEVSSGALTQHNSENSTLAGSSEPSETGTFWTIV